MQKKKTETYPVYEVKILTHPATETLRKNYSEENGLLESYQKYIG